MFKSSPFGGLLPFRGNGSMQPLGGTSLASALVAITRAEEQLAAARAVAKASAKREGKGVRNLFSDGAFVARSSAERWVDQAREAGIKVGWDQAIRGMTMSEDPPFQHIAKRLKQPGAMERQRAVAAKLEATGFKDALNAGDYDEAARILVQVQREEETGKVTGDRRARMSADAAGEVPEPKRGSFAAKVIECGKRRRGEI